MLMRIAIENNGNNNKIITMSIFEWEFEGYIVLIKTNCFWCFFESILKEMQKLTFMKLMSNAKC